MKNYSVLIKCGTTSPEQLASVLTRMKFYPDDYRYTLAKLLQGCDAIIDQSAEPTQDAESPTERIHCARCGKAVSTPVPKPTIVRAWVECPECIETTATATALLEGTKPQTIPYHAPNCFECLQVDVPLRLIEGKLICAECARYKYPGL